MATKSASSASRSMRAAAFKVGDRVMTAASLKLDGLRHVGTITKVLKLRPKQYRVRWDNTGNTTTVSPLVLVRESSSDTGANKL